jgi:pimeloyl-ACP methyl ester carboxylesterase
MRSRWSWAIAGLILILAGGLLAHFTQTAGGIRIEDVRFKGAAGNTMSALLYIPPNATAQTPAPGILAVHGYINSRETQDGFAIEFARRGYVVLALDQTGHGYSDPPSFVNGFGGPDGLAHLRSLDIVDKNNIGLEGHSMGGWTVLAAAATMPNDYKSIVLEGSSPGKPFAAEGTASWPRNVALVFARYEEFPALMWGVDLARDVTQSPKLWALFGTSGAVEPGKVYGDIAQGTARVLYTPSMTHPAEHISHEAIGYSLDWFGKTLQGGTPRPPEDQIWFRKEIGTLIALIGFVALLIGVFDGLLEAPMFSHLRLPAVADGSVPAASASSGSRWTIAFVLSAFIPALTYYPAFALAGAFVAPSHFLPQGVTNQIMVWAVINGLIALALMPFAPKRASRSGIIGPSILIALATVIVAMQHFGWPISPSRSISGSGSSRLS